MNATNLETSFVANPRTLIPILEERHPQSCFIYNQVQNSENFKDDFKFYIIGKEINSSTWIISRHIRENVEDNVSISAPATKLTETQAEEIKKFLSSTHLINWEEVIFVALDKQVSKIVTDISVNLKGNVTEIHPCMCYYIEKEDALKLPINSPPEVTIRRLKGEKESEFISSNWKYSHEANVSKCIEFNASSGVFVNGDCASGAIMAEVGFISALYTKSEHRNKGYAKLTMQFLFKEAAKNGCFPCSSVELRNSRSIAFHQSLGCKVAAIVDWIGISKLVVD